FIYDAVSQRHRSICATYTNILSGVGILTGSIVGGLIVNYLHPTGISPYVFVFLIASFLRFTVAIIFLPQIKEVKKVSKLPSYYSFFAHSTHFLHTESAKIFHIPLKFLGKFKSIKIFLK
ncbi:MAG: hypothetical protein N3D20_03145, partial [Candidatus Pacearchaeota archaeon]|nr:hypothetical protein [Candidatus Pacearchaeota archaeon]